MGRIIFGTIFDLLGRKKEMKIIEILFAISILILILYINSGNIYLAIIGYIGCGLSYGGITATNSAFTNDLFGKKNYASNFSIVSLSLIIASFISNLGSVLYNKTDSYYAIFIGMIIFVFIGSIGSIMIKN